MGSAFERILAGTDGSLRAEEAVRQAARLASLTGAELEVVYVFDQSRPPGPFRDPSAPTAYADHALEEAGRIADKEDVEATLRVLVGDPAIMLVHHAQERWADLVCVGADAGLFEKPHLLGGVAVHVVRNAHASVLVSRAPEESLGMTFPGRVLCAVDGSDCSMEAVRTGAALAAQAEASFRLLHVVPVISGYGVGWTAVGEPSGFEPLSPAVEVAERMGLDPAREMALGRPAPVIAETARSEGVDLVALGSRGLHGLSRVLLGSVSEWVARHAGCSVLVTRKLSARR
ncbi:MAG: universal stress protein [Actinomycetota bacterium]|nr:universal stress protein [Actinomycetota bacterium]